MEPSLPIVRIVILGSTSTVLHSAGSARLTEVSAPEAASSHAGTSVVALHDTRAALARLGGEVSVDLISDPHADLSALAFDALDLFVLDCIDPEEASLWLELVRDIGPPVLAIQRDDDDDSALQLFRCGADQCVRLGSDYMHVVPATALEMIHRWQRKRERGQVERHIEWLEGFNDAIVNQIPAALAVIDGEGKVATLNPLFSQLLGVAAGEAPGRLFSAVCDA
ncbi:MAG: PAS domain-containing protein, partial [Myxococcales bacterium]